MPQPVLQDLHIKTYKSKKDEDCLGSFLHAIGKHKLLSPAEEKSLGTIVRKAMVILEEHPKLKISLSSPSATSEQADIIGIPLQELNNILRAASHARRRLIEANLRLVVLLAKGYARKQEESLVDLIQEGSIGLNRAAEKFDPTKGFKFSTYASCWIRQAITRSITQHSRTIRLPVMVSEQINKLKRVSKRLSEVQGEEPTIEALAKAVGLTEERVKNLQNWSRRVCSSDIPVGNYSDCKCTLGELVETEDETPDKLQSLDFKMMLTCLMEDTNNRERRLLTWKFGLDGEYPMTAKEIGLIEGVSHERIRQICNEELQRLKQKALDIGFESF